MGNIPNDTPERKPKIKKDGAKVHVVAFIASLVLTMFAFLAVAYKVIPVSFAIPFIVILAIVQAAFQMFIWMHMDQKGHEYARIGIATGIVVVVPMVWAFIYTIW